ncbi:MAG: alpha/beta hydrolase [Pseudomonadota bacterium]
MRRAAARLLFPALLFTVAAAGCVKFQQGKVDYGPAKNQFVEIDGQRIRYIDVGEGEPVLLIHGFGSALEAWQQVIPRLREGRRVIALDLPGFGKSDKHDRDYSSPSLAETVHAFMQKLGIEKADVVAHSWGCSIALALAMQRPASVRRLVLSGAWVFEEQLPPFAKWARVPVLGEIIFGWTYKELIAQRLALGFYEPEKIVDQKFVDAVEKAMDRPGAVAAALAATRGQRFENMEKHYAAVTQKTLIVWGREDEVARPLYGEKLSNIIPNARLVFIPQCGHLPMVERPVQFANKVLEFLDFKETGDEPLEKPAEEHPSAGKAPGADPISIDGQAENP